MDLMEKISKLKMRGGIPEKKGFTQIPFIPFTLEEQERFTESLLRHIIESGVLENVRNNLPSNLN